MLIIILFCRVIAFIESSNINMLNLKKNTFYVFVDRIILLNFPQCNRKFAKKCIYSILNKDFTFPIFGHRQK